MTSIELAGRVGVSVNSVTHWMSTQEGHGTRPKDISAFVRVADALELGELEEALLQLIWMKGSQEVWATALRYILEKTLTGREKDPAGATLDTKYRRIGAGREREEVEEEAHAEA